MYIIGLKSAVVSSTCSRILKIVYIWQSNISEHSIMQFDITLLQYRYSLEFDYFNKPTNQLKKFYASVFRGLNGQQVAYKIFLKFDLLRYKIFLVTKKDPNVLALKFKYFPISLYTVLFIMIVIQSKNDVDQQAPLCPISVYNSV